MANLQGIGETIDYSSVTPELQPSQTKWRAPRHVYFGKKLDDGSMEEEPKYEHKEFPQLVYARIAGQVTAKLAEDAAEFEDLLAEGWIRGNELESKLNIITCPSHEQIEAAKDASRGKKK